MLDFIRFSDAMDPGKPGYFAVDFRAKLDLIAAFRLVPEKLRLLLDGHADLIRVGLQIIRLRVRQEKILQRGGRVLRRAAA